MKAFLNAISLLPDDFKKPLSLICDGDASNINEVRFRSNMPVRLNSRTEAFFVTESGRLTSKEETDVLTCSDRQLQEIVFSLSRRSIHTYQDMIAKGFIPLRGGCKAGVVGCAVLRNGEVYSVSSFNSVNIRVSREYYGSSRDVINAVKDCTSYLIVGKPLSGKTTVLRDLCRYYSGKNAFSPKKVAVIDERDEIASLAFGGAADVGLQTDVLSLYPKAVGADIALRTLSPDIIMLDEIGANDETEVLLSSMNCGVGVIATAHGGSYDEVIRRPNIKRLVKAGVFKKMVILNGKESPCTVKEAVSF